MTPPHLFDPRTQLKYIVWHGDPMLEEWIRHLIDEVKPDVWVETGTHMGWTSIWIAENYPNLPIYTVEVDPEFHRKSSENLAAYSSVKMVAHDSSPNFLYKLLPDLRDRLPIFWLDAHWWPPVPLREECRAVSQLPRYVCLLDDFSCWNPDFSGDTFFTIAPSGGDAYLNDISYVCSELGEHYWRPNYPSKPGYKGVGLFKKRISYVPPSKYMREETLESFIATRPKSVDERPNDPSMAVYPLHPSCGRTG